VLENVSRIIGRPVGQPPSGETPAQRAIREQMASVGQAVRLRYIGEAQRTSAPDVVRSFVLDQDLEDPGPEPSPARRPLEPRVLLTAAQLSDVATTLRVITEQMVAGRLDRNSFHSRLRSAMGATFADPRRVPASQSADVASLFGDFLNGLPYRSAFMELTIDDIRSMGGVQFDQLRQRLERRIRLYAEYNRERRYWVQLDGNTNPGEAVFPLALDDLP
jgi:hypothetical protein